MSSKLLVNCPGASLRVTLGTSHLLELGCSWRWGSIFLLQVKKLKTGGEQTCPKDPALIRAGHRTRV